MIICWLVRQYLPFIIFTVIVAGLLIGCSSTKKISATSLFTFSSKPFYEWSLEECKAVIEVNTQSSYVNSIQSKISPDDVIVTALPMTVLVLQALARKEALLKRLTHAECKSILNDYFAVYSNYEYSPEINQVIKKNIPGDSLKGLSFQVTFRNNTDPYRPIILEDGYGYFFLENGSDDFARVVEVSGKYAETDFYLTDYLEIVLTFSTRSESDKILFDDFSSLKNFQVVFNGLDKDPIILKWEISVMKNY
jgi:hypothetical protein